MIELPILQKGNYREKTKSGKTQKIFGGPQFPAP